MAGKLRAHHRRVRVVIDVFESVAVKRLGDKAVAARREHVICCRGDTQRMDQVRRRTACVKAHANIKWRGEVRELAVCDPHVLQLRQVDTLLSNFAVLRLLLDDVNDRVRSNGGQNQTDVP